MWGSILCILLRELTIQAYNDQVCCMLLDLFCEPIALRELLYPIGVLTSSDEALIQLKGRLIITLFLLDHSVNIRF